MQEIDNSLRRLGTDWIDLYQVHRPDRKPTSRRRCRRLTDLQRAGKIRAFGSSTFPAYQMVQAQWASQSRALGRFVTEQQPYSILARRGSTPMCCRSLREYGIGVGSGPLAGGWLTGQYRKGLDLPQTFRSRNRQDMSDPGQHDAATGGRARSRRPRRRSGHTLVHLALAFVLQHPAVTAPIIGPRTMEQLETQVGAVDVVLTSDVLDRIDEIVPPGVNVSCTDAGYVPPALANKNLRRRRTK